jgi:hypothetical protein
MLGVDFLLHAGLLAGLYARLSPFLLPPIEAFRRIPLGYAGFLLLAILLAWMLPRFNISTWKGAFWFGIKLGAMVWGSFVLGLISISAIEPDLAAAWFLGQTLELGVGAAVVQEAAGSSSLRRITLLVSLFVVLAIVITVALQTFGIVPTIRI